ncbi:Pentapeptide repeat-containing protein [Parafrankia irregularis]|uniref:Pentapeptide repeat-containing protein n=1 Tax=Parafrankia irregularis TaxID=795642 RepID=A0A0S4QHZ5_9ACTN|nr:MULTISPECIES: pentapeptide repeat-containing protein [Parafrankia]MBE3203901.1 pentapeptide repeat-containing protein [Parafrankia sp. CH37]CUU55227.1 Pentapeptide repeat-containing protein [Parafrankia irregularis]
MIAICAIIGAGCMAAAVFFLPHYIYPGTDADVGDARAALQSGLLTAATTLIAVAGGLIALSETRQANAEIRHANANTHVRELYVEAVKLLNDNDLGIRLGGIYALERIATDSPEDQRMIVEVLSAFVRVRSVDLVSSGQDSPQGDPDSISMRAAVDVHAAVTVLGRLPVLDGVPRADLTGSRLTGLAALAGLQATGANFARVDLTGADLTGARLGGADFTGTMLVRADLTNAFLDSANLTDALLIGANLTEARLANVTLSGAYLGGANLSGARLEGANLSDIQGLSYQQLSLAMGNGWTSLPSGMPRPDSWER